MPQYSIPSSSSLQSIASTSAGIGTVLRTNGSSASTNQISYSPQLPSPQDEPSLPLMSPLQNHQGNSHQIYLGQYSDIKDEPESPRDTIAFDNIVGATGRNSSTGALIENQAVTPSHHPLPSHSQISYPHIVSASSSTNSPGQPQGTSVLSPQNILSFEDCDQNMTPDN